MDGYTVDEAASVLGVPQARVWELLARGVLAGAPEGESGMRVFLKGSAGEEVTNRPERAEPGRGSNGNGGQRASESGEMSPFRELLTEFRNLTERYGQALLALGEARGEVASLRSRVELLEARIDLRLPASRPASTVAWEMPDYATPSRSARTDAEAETEPEVQPDAVSEAEPAVAAGELAEEAPIEVAPVAEAPAEELLASEATPEESPADAELPAPEPVSGESAADEAPPVSADRATARRKRLHPGREAISGLAEALARAQDPTLADLPGAREAAEALAELRREIDAGSVTEQPAEAAEPETRAPIAEAAAFRAAQVERPEAVEEPIAAAAIPLEELAPEEGPLPDEAVAFEEEIAHEEEPLPEEAAAFEEEIAPAAEIALPEEPAAVAEAEPHVAEDVAAASAEEPQQPSHYSTEVVEPDWFADGDFTWLEAAEAERTEAEAREDAQPQVTHVEESMAAGSPASPDVTQSGEVEPEEAAALQVEPIDTELPATELPAADLPADELPTADIPEERADDLGETGADTAAEPAALLDESWNEPAGEPAWAAPTETTKAREAPEATVAVVPDLEAEPESQEVGDEWPASEAEVSEPTPPRATTPEVHAVASSRSTPRTGDALGGFRAATSEELGQPPPGLARPGEEELMWLGDEFEAAGLEIAAQGWRGEAPSVEQEAAKPPVFELSDEELARLAQDEGWNIDEVNAIRAFLARPDEEAQPVSEPTAAEPIAAEPTAAEPTAAEPTAAEPTASEPIASEPTAPEPRQEPEVDADEAAQQLETDALEEIPASPQPSAVPTGLAGVSLPPAPPRALQPPRPMPAEPDPEWLRGRRGPAATAYRRLRRLFPG